jgi:ribosomal protein S18 acetylase RimI-like enzyme
MLVRPFQDEDLEQVGLLHSRSRQAAYAGLVPAAALAAVTPEAQVEVWRRRVNRDSGSVFVAENEGALVGFASLLITSEGCELDAIHVDPRHAGAGVGSALLRAAVEHARSRSIDRLHLHVIGDNERAQAFYRRAGWELTGPAGTHDIGGAEASVVRYELALK